MPYNSTITFTLDVICPWTYIGYLRLQKALFQYRSSYPSTADAPVTFSLKLAPYQLYPDFSSDGEDRYKWYKREKYNNDEQKIDIFTKYMGALGRAEGVEIEFKGTIANTLHAHRVLHCIQEAHGSERAVKALESLYKQYFAQGKHPSAKTTLVEACRAAGLEEAEAKTLVGDESDGLGEVEMGLREQVGNDVDSVPHVVVEGRRRDFTLVGAKETEEYEKALRQVEKEV